MIISCRLSFIIIHFLVSYAHAVSFSITHFDRPGANNIIYEGDAIASDGAIELINLVDYTCRVGRATYAERVPLWDSSTGTLADFNTRFSFTIDTLNSTKYGHGIAFFLGPVGYSIPPNSASGFLGIVNSTARSAMSRTQLVAVEFDTFVNKEWDPPMQHVGINNNSIFSDVSAIWNPGSNSGKVANVLITYNATTKDLSVFWTYDENPTFTDNSSLSYQIDLMQVLPPWVTIGFSAATGEYLERNTVHSWEFTSNFVPNEGDGKKPHLKTQWIVLIAAACLIVLVVLGFGIYWLIKKIKGIFYGKRSSGGRSRKTDLESAVLPKSFSYQELLTATKGFAKQRQLGEGGSGFVYKGALTDPCCLVAVKKVSPQSERLFDNEVRIISSLKHRTLVQFLGWCHERDEFLLVYEYMAKGSLHDRLFGSKKTLPWNSRYNTALTVATALKYLHDDAEHQVLHRDIKPENILLRGDFTAKVGDFGISKFVNTQLRTQRTNPVGTPGYVAPEYRRDGRATTHSDMYSFGVVALEIACGRRNYRNNDPLKAVKEVWTQYRAGNILEAADRRLKEFNLKEMECLMIVGLLCTHPTDRERPSAGEVIKFLNFEAPLPELPPMLHDPEFPHNSDINERNTR